MKLLAALFLLTAVLALAFSALLVMPADASAADLASFGSTWSGLVERVDGDTAYVRLESCDSLWKGGATGGCGVGDASRELASSHFAAEGILDFAAPLDLVAVESVGGWLPGVGDRVTIRESFARLCGGNRPTCERGPVVPSYVLEKPPVPGMGSFFFWPGLLGGSAAIAGLSMFVRGWRGGSFKTDPAPSAAHVPGALA